MELAEWGGELAPCIFSQASRWFHLPVRFTHARLKRRFYAEASRAGAALKAVAIVHCKGGAALGHGGAALMVEIRRRSLWRALKRLGAVCAMGRISPDSE